jgi:hypothetical protein
MNELVVQDRDQEDGEQNKVRRIDELQRPRVAFPLKLALVAAFCVLVATTIS